MSLISFREKDLNKQVKKETLKENLKLQLH